jgi:hypothetical protein
MTTFASTATSGLAWAVAIVEFHELVIELFAFGVRQVIAASAILRSNNRADGLFFSPRFLSLHGDTLAAPEKSFKAGKSR